MSRLLFVLSTYFLDVHSSIIIGGRIIASFCRDLFVMIHECCPTINMKSHCLLLLVHISEKAFYLMRYHLLLSLMRIFIETWISLVFKWKIILIINMRTWNLKMIFLFQTPFVVIGMCECINVISHLLGDFLLMIKLHEIFLWLWIYGVL